MSTQLSKLAQKFKIKLAQYAPADAANALNEIKNEAKLAIQIMANIDNDSYINKIITYISPLVSNTSFQDAKRIIAMLVQAIQYLRLANKTSPKPYLAEACNELTKNLAFIQDKIILVNRLQSSSQEASPAVTQAPQARKSQYDPIDPIFQTMLGVKPDGLLGPNTRAALNFYKKTNLNVPNLSDALTFDALKKQPEYAEKKPLYRTNEGYSSSADMAKQNDIGPDGF